MMTELMAIAVLLLLRIGIPILLIAGLSYVAYRLLAPDTSAPHATAARPAAARLGGPAPLARIIYSATPCWDIKSCPADLQATCPARARPELPCWLAVQMKTGQRPANCEWCRVYDSPTVHA